MSKNPEILPGSPHWDAAAALVAQCFPRLAFAPVTAAAEFIGKATQTAYNELHDGNFPLPTVQMGRRQFVPIPALIEFVADLYGKASIPPKRRSRGRPRKVVTSGGGEDK